MRRSQQDAPNECHARRPRRPSTHASTPARAAASAAAVRSRTTRTCAAATRPTADSTVSAPTSTSEHTKHPARHITPSSRRQSRTTTASPGSAATLLAVIVARVDPVGCKGGAGSAACAFLPGVGGAVGGCCTGWSVGEHGEALALHAGIAPAGGWGQHAGRAGEAAARRRALGAAELGAAVEWSPLCHSCCVTRMLDTICTATRTRALQHSQGQQLPYTGTRWALYTWATTTPPRQRRPCGNTCRSCGTCPRTLGCGRWG